MYDVYYIPGQSGMYVPTFTLPCVIDGLLEFVVVLVKSKRPPPPLYRRVAEAGGGAPEGGPPYGGNPGRVPRSVHSSTDDPAHAGVPHGLGREGRETAHLRHQGRHRLQAVRLRGDCQLWD